MRLRLLHEYSFPKPSLIGFTLEVLGKYNYFLTKSDPDSPVV